MQSLYRFRIIRYNFCRLATFRIQMTHLYSSYSFYSYSIITTQTAFKYRYSVYARPFAL